MYLLQNEEISIQVDTVGAELKSLKSLKNGQEYMWYGDEKYWKQTSPLLFPLIGRSKNGEIKHKGKVYPALKHGFARKMPFVLLEQLDTTLWLGLSDTEETLSVYPFPFSLSVGYQLTGKKLTVMWKLVNSGKETMYFSIGGHPAFQCPISKDEKRSDYFIKFDTDKQIISRGVTDDGFINDEYKTYPLDEGYLPIADDLFDRDALLIEQHQTHSVSLARPDKTPYITVCFDMPLFGIWSPPDPTAPFISFEPWYGSCDHKDFHGELADQELRNALAPGKEFNASYSIEIS